MLTPRRHSPRWLRARSSARGTSSGEAEATRELAVAAEAEALALAAVAVGGREARADAAATAALHAVVQAHDRRRGEGDEAAAEGRLQGMRQRAGELLVPGLEAEAGAGGYASDAEGEAGAGGAADLGDLLSFALASTEAHDASEDRALWKALFRARWPALHDHLATACVPMGRRRRVRSAVCTACSFALELILNKQRAPSNSGGRVGIS